MKGKVIFMLKTYSAFMKEVNYSECGIDLYKTIEKEAIEKADKEYCKVMIELHERAIEDFCKQYPIFASLYKLNKTRSKAS